MKKDYLVLAKSNLEKAVLAIELVEASVESIEPYNYIKQYTPKEREPYDALSDRFSRSVEICLKFYRSYEMYFFGEQSNTTRDLLNRMEKQELISAAKIWMEMRDIRNRIVHDYLPQEVQELYDSIINDYSVELVKAKTKLKESLLSFK